MKNIPKLFLYIFTHRLGGNLGTQPELWEIWVGRMKNPGTCKSKFKRLLPSPHFSEIRPVDL